jgi:hypothetical protein
MYTPYPYRLGYPRLEAAMDFALSLWRRLRARRAASR